MSEYRVVDAPVRGGSLRAGIWEPAEGTASDDPPVLLVHGITASHRAWVPVADQLPGRTVVAPDLRGRGRSADLPGPYGMTQHADDLVALLDHLGIDRAVVVGHSMGGFVSTVFAHQHPERVAGLLLVDGGLPLPLPEGVSADDLLKALLGPALERLSTTFTDREAYHGFWRAHPAFANDWSDAVVDYADYDLVGAEPELRSSVNADAVTEDSRDQLTGDALQNAALALADRDARFLRAPRGLQDEPRALYPEELVAAWAERLPRLSWTTVPDVNHYTLVLGAAGARVVADEIASVPRWT